MRSSGTAARAIRQWWIGVHELAGDLHAARRPGASASSVALTEPSSEFSIGTSARSTRPSRDRQRRRRGRSASGTGSRSAAAAGQHRLLAVGPGRAEEADPHPCSVAAALAGERPPHRLRLLGRELELAAPVDDLLAVDARRVAVDDRGEHDAVALGVEQRDRRRLVARSARRRRRSGPARGRRSRRRAAPRRPRGARRRSSRPPRRGRAAPAKACCSEAAWATRSVSPCSPSTSCCADRSRRTRTASTMREQERDQRHGTRRQGGDARRIGQVVHGSSGYERD